MVAAAIYDERLFPLTIVKTLQSKERTAPFEQSGDEKIEHYWIRSFLQALLSGMSKQIHCQ